MNQTGRVALVTGGNRGLGLETCAQLAAAGMQVVLGARGGAEARAAAARLAEAGHSVAGCALDVTIADQILAAAELIRTRYGRLDVLVNNAGVLLDGGGLSGAASVFDADLDTLRRTFETNLHGPLRMIQAAVPLMRSHGYGRIVNVSSNMGQLLDMGGGWPAYRMSKAALNALTRIVHAEIGDESIKVNAVSPGWVRTDMGGARASLSVREGADSIVWAATLAADGPSGAFIENRRVIPW